MESWDTTMTGHARNLDLKDIQGNYKNINILRPGGWRDGTRSNTLATH